MHTVETRVVKQISDDVQAAGEFDTIQWTIFYDY
jgi:hypothetical protein